MSPEMSPVLTPTGTIPPPSEPETTQHNGDAERVFSPHDWHLDEGRALNIRVPQSPLEHLRLSVAMTFGDGTVSLRAIDVGVVAEGNTAQDAFGRLIAVTRERLATSEDARAELLRYPPTTWFRFVPPNQAYYWTPEWQEGEAEAEREIRRGEIRRFTNLKDALRWLDNSED